MLNGKKIVVVMPAYQRRRRCFKLMKGLPHDVVDDMILVDDCSSDHTAEIARSLNITTIVHEQNQGYGGNQKTCYEAALNKGADVVVMVHPDYQYEPRLVTAIASLVWYGSVKGGTREFVVSENVKTFLQNFGKGEYGIQRSYKKFEDLSGY